MKSNSIPREEKSGIEEPVFQWFHYKIVLFKKKWSFIRCSRTFLSYLPAHSSCETHRTLYVLCIWNNKVSSWRRCILWQVFHIFATYKCLGKCSSTSLSKHRIQLSSFTQLLKSLIISKMCKACSATDFRFISWSHTAHSSGIVPSRIHNFGLHPSFFALSASQ